MAKANSLIKNVLRECSTDLVADLSPEPAINYFWVEGLITDAERDHIRTVSRSRITQAGELLDVLRSKGNNALDALLKYLEEDGTQFHMLEMLKDSIEKHSKGKSKPDATGAAATTDFPLSFSQISKITNILVEDGRVLDNWTEIKHGFIDKAVDLFEIDNLSTPKVGSKIRRTLELWISRKGELATFEELIKILNNENHGYISGKLQENRELIKKL